ncbi:hypothetical protein TrLO_g6825 [Triparma laevis f. longispina]|uniref:Uncharacterized protein n=1 Tax=Triparma laevis f. longispina TaxID=1714387 RepID=A0A9W7KRU3_9STRA|nr:hypothetical protein TrLO_g6825 [Triparma laevis f. longispina]
MLYQKLMEGSSGEESVVVFWSFMVDVTKSCEAALRLKRARDDDPPQPSPYCQQIDLKGLIPKFVVNSRTVQTLEYLSTMRKNFDKSLEIDAGQRSEIIKKIKREEDVGRLEASAQFEALFKEKKGWERPSRSFGLADSKVQANAVGGKGWGSTSINVRAEIEEVAALFWDFGSCANMEISGDVERNFKEYEEGEVASRGSSSDANKFRAAMVVVIVIVHSRARWHSNELTTTR